MKLTILLNFILLFFIAHAEKQIVSVDYISNVKINKDIVVEGALGIGIDYTIDFSAFRKSIGNDSILDLSNFIFNVTFSENKIKIKPSFGYDKNKSKAGSLQYTKKYGSFEFSTTQPIKESIFIPYAAFNLSEGLHNINVLIGLNGAVVNGNSYNQTVIVKDIAINTPKRLTTTINIDYIEVNEIDKNNKFWDLGYFGKAAPDVSVMLKLGSFLVWRDGVNDTHVYAKGPRSKNIQFSVGANDILTLLVVDDDVMLSDFIGKTTVSVKATELGKTFNFPTKFESVKDCAATYKIE